MGAFSLRLRHPYERGRQGRAPDQGVERHLGESGAGLGVAAVLVHAISGKESSRVTVFVSSARTGEMRVVSTRVVLLGIDVALGCVW